MAYDYGSAPDGGRRRVRFSQDSYDVPVSSALRAFSSPLSDHSAHSRKDATKTTATRHRRSCLSTGGIRWQP